MIYRNMEALQLSAAWKVVKVGDTISDIQEGVCAGVWSVGVIIGSSEMGLTSAEFDALTKEERIKVINKTAETFLRHGADFTIQSIGELPALIEEINHLIAEGERPRAGAYSYQTIN
ncbi:hypothetical protein MKY41_13245 [Sporosarcina sp. FSL W7-1349]|uniref:hypothetical protein n=1 Tax=Sporosarcina sp. FSL W7-1349 TaxID=2921561 RepID=UPI0030FAAC5A